MAVFSTSIFPSSQVSKVHNHSCLSLAVSDDSRFLLTAGHKTLKVWDYNMQFGINSQVKLLLVAHF